MQLFFNPDITDRSEQINFNKEESRHIVKVLRKGQSDSLRITNGKGWLFEAQITGPDPKQCIAQITSSSFVTPRKYRVHLAVAPTKTNDRYEWFLEKATEIGVDSITPLICERSERKTIKSERYRKIVLAAMKQSMYPYLPELNESIAFNTFLNEDHHGQLFIAHCEPMDRKTFKSQLKPHEDVTVLIGPEGDFSVKEIEKAIKTGFIPVTLGDTRLRTETAAVVASHAIAFINS